MSSLHTSDVALNSDWMSPGLSRTISCALRPTCPAHLTSYLMTHTMRPSVLLLSLPLLVAACAVPAPRVSLKSDVAAAVSAELRRGTDAHEHEGGALMVISNGKVLLTDHYGNHDLETQRPFASDTIFRIFSMTKPITTVAAMTLWEQGKFQLDDPVSKYIPSFAKVQVGEVDGGKLTLRAPSRAITIRDLMCHGAGFSYAGTKDTPIGALYHENGLSYGKPWAMYPPKMSIRAAADALARVPIRHDPGAKWTYGPSVDVLGALIEIWSKEPLDDCIERVVLEPLAMNDTAFVVPVDKADRFASCHAWQEGKQVVVDPWNKSDYLLGFEFLGGGSGLVSTMQDYGRFATMLCNWGSFEGQRILKKQTLQLMFSPQIAMGDERHFGLGFVIAPVTIGSGETAVDTQQYGWGGYANTEFKVIPDLGLAMIFMRQTVPSTHRVSGKLFEMVRGGVTVE